MTYSFLWLPFVPNTSVFFLLHNSKNKNNILATLNSINKQINKKVCMKKEAAMESSQPHFCHFPHVKCDSSK